MIEVKNAVIESVSLSIADHGVLSGWLYLCYGGAGAQGFGGFVLAVCKDNPAWSLESCAGHFIWRCMEIAGVTEWERLPGRSIRVRGSDSGIEAIGHFLNEDWFCPSVDFAALRRRGVK